MTVVPRFMFTIALAMTLRPGAYEQYKLAHDQLWPELATGMHENQINMAIYRDGDPPVSLRNRSDL
jgi:L-rhamnose mutarotase